MSTTTFILVHGAWHDSRCWHDVAELLSTRGHSVLVPDLCGHGQSGVQPSRATLKGYVNQSCQLIEDCAAPVVLVGHSMAGVVITAVAERLPSRIAALVYLCAYLPLPGDSVFALIARNRGHEPLSAIELALEMSDDKRTCTIDSDAIAPLFYSDVDSTRLPALMARFGIQGSLPLAAAVDYDPGRLGKLARHYICCTRDRVIPLHHQQRMLARHDGFHVHMLAADHSPFYSCASALATLLDSITTTASPAKITDQI